MIASIPQDRSTAPPRGARHADAATYRSWITQAGLSVEREEFVPEGDSGHALVWASRPARPIS